MFEQCAAPFTDVEDMLMSLAKIIEQQTPMISEILTVGKSLKDETSPEILSRSGAKLLTLLEPFLESLVPTEVGRTTNLYTHFMTFSSCPGVLAKAPMRCSSPCPAWPASWTR